MNIKRIIQAAYTKLKVHRWIAWLLCAAMVGSMLSSALSALAVNENDIDNIIDDIDSEDAYCVHHPEHTEDCGYVEAVEGQPCTHEHGEECGYEEDSEATECTHEHDDDCGYVEEQPCTHEHDEECGYEEGSETAECSHEHDDDCGYAEGQPCTHEHDGECGYAEEAVCTHEHDDDCGYVEAVEGQPCQFVCEICADEPGQVATMAAAEPVAVAAEPEKGLIAYFKFDEAGGRLQDYSGKGVTATLRQVSGRDPVPGSVISDPDELGGYFDETGGNANALHLEDNACLVLTETEDFNNLTDVTVEMRIKITERETPPDQHWLFYAAPTSDKAEVTRTFLGAFIDPSEKINIARSVNNNPVTEIDNAEFLSDAGGYRYGEWYTVKAIYKPSTMALYIDGNRVVEADAPNKTSEYFGVDKTLWFGHSAWNDAHFNGYIDYIKIYNYLNYDGLHDGLIDEEQYIDTDRVVDPANTTVNMFDYWLTGQLNNDYDPEFDRELWRYEIWNSGINKGHLFLFNGDNVTSSANPRTSDVGSWNCYVYGRGQYHETYEPFSGIVKNVLDNGYPQLAIDDLKENNETDHMYGEPTAAPAENQKMLEDEKKLTESLAYLFDPGIEHDSKASYPDVTGLFRLSENGYYYFESPKNFAELNAEQSSRPKESVKGNHITLYKKTWKDETRGQFYPFNDWSDLFYRSDGDELGLKQALWIDKQSTTDEPMNHYFGMTVETEFQQPVNGSFDRGVAGKDPMKFEFSGDDDVWIFIDDVLVGDLGGLHQRIRIEIDFSTGKIDYTGELGDDGYPNASSKQLETFDTDLYTMFTEANALRSIQWKEGENGNMIFADGSIHTLKFFYLERGNNASNCSISFNLMEPPTDRIRKTDENGDPLAGAEFALYNARHTGTDTIKSGEWWHTADEFETEGEPLTTVTSRGNGYAELTDNTGGPIPFNNGAFYILRETGTPAGYRTNPDIVLQFHGETSTFIVVNKYETGAYASFLSHWTYYDNVNLNYAKYLVDGTFTPDGTIVNTDLENSLAVMVPLYKQTDGNGFVRWLPLYGSNTNGWYTIADSYQNKTGGNTEDAFIKDVALAAILQIADTDERTPNWYLNYSEDGQYFDGYMENLPGDATRYENVNVDGSRGSGDLRLVTLFLSEEVLRDWGLQDPGASEGDFARYQALQEVLRPQLQAHTEEGAKRFLDDKSGVPKLLYSDSFTRSNRSVIYIPNEQRELRVRKTCPVEPDASDEPDDPDDTEVEYVNGAVFAIFNTWQEAAGYKATASDAAGVMAELEGKALSYGITSTITLETSPEEVKEDGWLIFREDDSAGDGYAKIVWPSQRSGEGDEEDNVLWLKEVFAPKGYALNENLIRIEVGNIAIYANATGYAPDGAILDEEIEDGITVQACLGKLSQTLVKYAMGNNVDVTLQDITITKQTAAKVGDEGELQDAADWTDDTSKTCDLHYNMNVNARALTGQYGPHHKDEPLPDFMVDNGYIRVMPRQNQKDYTEDSELAKYHDPGINKADLTGPGPERKPIDLGNLFGLMNVVVVEDKLAEEEEQPEEPSHEKPSKKPEDPQSGGGQPEEPAEPLPSDNPVAVSAEKEDGTRPIGIMASPRTGDSRMVVLWLVLLAFSISGITTLAKVYHARKCGDKGQET